MGVSIAKLPGAKPKPLSATDACPSCKRMTLVVCHANEAYLDGLTDRFVRCVACGHRGPLGGLRLVK